MVRRVAVVLALSLAVLAAGMAVWTSGGTVLVVEDATTGERLLTVPVDEGSVVTLAYTHSVEKTPVEDRYVVDGDRLDNDLMRFQSYGWGLPARADVTERDGWFVFDPDRSYESIVVQPGRVAGHVLVVDGESYDLVALSDARAVRLAVEHRRRLPDPI